MHIGRTVTGIFLGPAGSSAPAVVLRAFFGPRFFVCWSAETMPRVGEMMRGICGVLCAFELRWRVYWALQQKAHLASPPANENSEKTPDTFARVSGAPA